MKKTFLVLLITPFILFGQLNGTKTIDAGGSGPDNYTTFSAAISALNSGGTTSGVVFRIANGTYTEANPLLINITTNKPSVSATVTFKPATGASCTLNVGGQVTGTRFALKIGTPSNSMDYIVLDGSNAEGGATRDWTIKATAATYGIEPIDIYGDYCTVKNCIVDMNSGGYSGSGFGITLRDSTPVATYCTIQNNKVTGNNAISIGRNTLNDMPGCLIKGNEVHCLNRGIYAYRSSTITIEDNEIIGDAYAGYPAGACYGIYTASPGGNTGELVIRNNIVRNLGSNSGTVAAQAVRGIAPSGPGTYKVYNNKVYNLYNATTSTGNPIVYGIQLSSGGSTSSYDVYNNLVYGLINNDPDASATVFTFGIQYNTSGNANIYYNSVYVEETTRDHLTAALQLTVGNAANNIYVRNNILYTNNTSSTYKSYALYKSATLVSVLNTSDYNCLYVDGATNAFVGFDGAADRTSLSDWINNTTYDDNSISSNPNFTSTTDLHINAGTGYDAIPAVSMKGTPIGGYTTDIDGDTRNATKPDIGADEFQISRTLTTSGTLPASDDYNNITVNGSSITASLGGNVSMSGTLTLTDGLMSLGSNHLTLGASSTISGTPSATKMIVAEGTGELRKTYTATGSFTFPVGDNTGTAEYSPVTLNFSSGSFSSAYAAVKLSNTKHGSNTSTTNYLNRNWTVSQSGITSFSCDATFTYTDGDVNGSEASIYGGKLDGGTWTGLGLVDATNNRISGNALTSFSSFHGLEVGVLPVELTSFFCTNSDKSVLLEWATATEVNSSKFVVERCDDGQNWLRVGDVQASGYSNAPRTYAFTDKNLMTAKYSYRLKIIDNDGTYEYSQVINAEVGAPTAFNVSQNYPNPFNPSTKINYDIPEDASVVLELYALTGEKIAVLVNEDVKAGYYSYQVNMNRYNLPSGVYVYRLVGSGVASENKFSSVKKMMYLR